MDPPEDSMNPLKRQSDKPVDSLSGMEKKKLKEAIMARNNDIEDVSKRLEENQLQQLIGNLELFQNQKNYVEAKIKVVEKKQEEWVLKEKMVQLDIENFQNEKQQCSIDMKIVESKTQELRSKIDELTGKKADLKSKKEQKISQFRNDKLWMENEEDEYAELIAENELGTKTDDRMKNEVEARKQVHEAEILAMDANLNLLQTQLDGFVNKEAENATLKSIILKKQEELNGQEENAKKVLEDLRIRQDQFSDEIKTLEVKKEKIDADIEATKQEIDDGNDGQDEQETEHPVMTQSQSTSNGLERPRRVSFTNDFGDPVFPIVRYDDSDAEHIDQPVEQDDEDIPNQDEQEDHDKEQEEGDEVQADEAPTDGPSCSTQDIGKAKPKKGGKRNPKSKKVQQRYPKSKKVQKRDSKAKVQERSQQIHKNYEVYNAKLHVKAYFREFGYTGASDAAKQAVDEIIASVEEKNCSVVQLVQGAPFPENECRGLKTQLMQITMAPRVEKPESGSSSSRRSWDYVRHLTYTGDMYLDVATVTGEDVIKCAAEFKTTKTNHVFGPPETEKICDVLEGDSTVVDAERTFFEQQSQHPLNGSSHPIPVISKDDEEGLKNLLANASIFMVDDVNGWNGFQFEAFNLEKISEVLKANSDVQVLRQVPQPTNKNFNFTAEHQKKDESGVYHFTEHHKLEDFLGNHKKCLQEVTREAYNEILASPANKDEILENLGEELRKHQLPLGKHEKDTEAAEVMKKKVPKSATLLSFGTNVDLTGEASEEQEKNCAKLPDSLAPAGRGTLLNLAYEKIPGLNDVQMYLKPPAARTTGHFESNSIGSININLGPGDCVWFAIPAEFSQSLGKILRNHRARKDTQRSAFAQTWWPNEEECIKEGIVFHKFVQKPGQLVYVCIGTYHWVQSDGYTANVSWNVMQPSFHQMAVAAIMNDHYLDLGCDNHSIVPIEYISWNMVISQEPVEEKDFRKLLKVIMMRSLANLQATLDFINNKKERDDKNKKKKKTTVALIRMEKTGVNPMTFGQDEDAVARCKSCAQVLFNFVPVNEENVILCFKCIHTKKGLNTNKINVIQCYDLDYLVSVFDGFQIE
ncbi:hypothetical protein B9Z55_026128 [Caenorhabditis nigoni]|uniref:JmjC domain-containing protein n=1 Tax=Caenorhabditis nigoni TaxID=1611254 RepID=A0A2G5T267_9PELO|nr:hypothetical protein B9Z55_026128 [Caenorhabditis nigoni]